MKIYAQIGAAAAAVFIPTVLFAQNSGQSAFELYQAGNVEAARASFKGELQSALTSKNPARIWQAYMSLAWFEDELSEHRSAIEHSNKALELANSINNNFMLGRSLCWLGWAYSGLGLYDAALSFYQNAAEIGAPKGEIQIVPVWGLATQEIGAIKFKMGETEEAEKLLLKTYNFAQEHGIDIGVAEGGAHLAEISLAAGKFAQAEQYAVKAIEAAHKCGCSPGNSTRARVVRAKVQLERGKFDRGQTDKIGPVLDELLRDCEQLKHQRCIAETKLMLSRMLPKEQTDKRYDLVRTAFEVLAGAESELRGVAEAEMGRVFLDQQNNALAQFYLQNGLKVDAEMLRKVDKAYITGNLSEAVRGEEKLQNLLEAVESARATKALALQISAELKLVQTLQELGYAKLALEEIEEALKVAEQLILNNPEDSPEHKRYEEMRILFEELRVELALELEHEAPAPN